MNPRYERAKERLGSLIQEGEAVARLERESSVGPYIQDRVPLHAWWVKVENIVGSIFGPDSAHFGHLKRLTDRTPEHSYEVLAIVGLMKGALDDLESGFLIGQELLVAGIIFDSVLEQAKHLTQTGFKDPAAVLTRVILEDALKRLCRKEGIDDSAKAAALNDALRDKGCYGKPQWRLVQAWLDIGNAAAHGEFSTFTRDRVLHMISDVERFLAQEFMLGAS